MIAELAGKAGSLVVADSGKDCHFPQGHVFQFLHRLLLTSPYNGVMMLIIHTKKYQLMYSLCKIYFIPLKNALYAGHSS